MSVMPVNNMLTRGELDALPDDGLRHELIDGVFVMSPAPDVGHQRMLGALYRALWQASQGSQLEVLVAPVDVVLGSSVVEPDIVVARSEEFGERGLASAPALAVEIRSQSTAWLDEGRKRSLYEEHGVASRYRAFGREQLPAREHRRAEANEHVHELLVKPRLCPKGRFE